LIIFITHFLLNEGASVADQIPFGTNDFAENPEPRVPCVLLLDTSGSMQGDPIRELNSGLVGYKDHLAADPLASKRVEVAVVTFGPVNVMVDFTTAEQFVPPQLEADGATPMGEAIVKAIEMVSARKQVYRQNGIAFYRPWIFMITDGAPTDSWEEAARRVKEGEAAKALSFWAVGVEGADLDKLKKIATREPIKLKGLRFRDLFQWLSNSQQSVSRSTVGEPVPLPSPAGWAEI
jgi:uncharacterized protein YegL